MSSIPSWSPAFSVGNDVLDAQHRLLLQLCQAAGEKLAATPQPNAHEIHVILNGLCLYARVHFATEEKLLREVGYPDIEAQQAEHDHYWTTLTHHLEAACAGRPDLPALHAFLSEWWESHILVSDMRYKAYLADSSPTAL